MQQLVAYNDYNLNNGQWVDPYTRLYTVGGTKYVAEISNYPRVKLNPAPRTYLKDTRFTVTRADCFDTDISGKDVFVSDRDGRTYQIGQVATHYIGEGLPGDIPKWVDDPLERSVLDETQYRFTVNAILRAERMRTAARAPIRGTDVTLSGMQNAIEFPIAPPIRKEILYVEYDRKKL